MTRHSVDELNNIHETPAWHPVRPRQFLRRFALRLLAWGAVYLAALFFGGWLLWNVGPFLPAGLAFQPSYLQAVFVFTALTGMVVLWRHMP